MTTRARLSRDELVNDPEDGLGLYGESTALETYADRRGVAGDTFVEVVVLSWESTRWGNGYMSVGRATGAVSRPKLETAVCMPGTI